MTRSACFATALLAALAVLAAPAAALDLRDLDGRGVRVSELDAEVTVLNFWATWCRPCRREMPIFVELQRELGPKGLRIVAASADEPGSERRIARVSRDWEGLLILQGATTADMEYFGLGTALPATAVFDSQGRLVHRVRGEIEKGPLREVITTLLEGGAPEPGDDPPPPAAEAAHRHGGPEERAEAGPDGRSPRAKKRASLVPS